VGEWEGEAQAVFEAAHDWRLVLASLAVAMMAGFTGP